MDQFNYLAVLISIVLGLGMTHILSSFGRWLENRGTFRAYGPAIAWAGIVLIVHVQTWWSMFGMRNHTHWTFLQFSLVLLQPIVLFLLSTLVLPGSSSPGTDLRENYFRQKPWFFGFLMALLTVSVLKDLLMAGELPEPMNLGFHAFLFLTSAGAIWTDRELYHRLLAGTSLLFMCLYIAVLFAELR